MTNLTARQRVLIYLRLHKGASAAEISRALRVTTANVRRHLSILAADGRVQVLGLRTQDGPGRPVQIYGAADTGVEEVMARLAGALLTQMADDGPQDKQDGMMRALAQRMRINRPGKAGEGGVNITPRLAASIELLNQQGYEARWEAHAAAPRIIFERCPFIALVAGHPELCRMDAFLLAEYLGRDVEQTAKLEKNTRGTLFCMFELFLRRRADG